MHWLRLYWNSSLSENENVSSFNTCYGFVRHRTNSLVCGVATFYMSITNTWHLNAFFCDVTKEVTWVAGWKTRVWNTGLEERTGWRKNRTDIRMCIMCKVFIYLWFRGRFLFCRITIVPVRAQLFGTLNNAMRYFQTSFNRISVIKHETITGCNRPVTYGVIKNHTSRWYSMGFSVMLWGAEFWYLPYTGALTVSFFLTGAAPSSHR